MATPPISREGYRQAILPLFQKKKSRIMGSLRFELRTFAV